MTDLTFSYPAGERKVLDNASLSLNKGQILCILGPNGAGKTTLLNCMAGLLRPQSGEIMLMGNKLSEMRERQIARHVAYVPQLHTPAFDYSVADFVLMGKSAQLGLMQRPKREDEWKCIEILRSMGIEHLAQKSYQKISGGERQQALIARALMQEPDVILFDEPTAHLDYGNQQRVLTQIKSMAEDGYSIVITTHNPDHALLLGDQAAIVDRNGHVTQGDCSMIISESNLKSIYNIDLKLVYIKELDRTVCMSPSLDDVSK